jgi:type IV secretion system protein VirD4
MAEQRPYRANASDTRLTTAISLGLFAIGAFALNSYIAQTCAARMGYDAALGPRLVGRLYQPWSWLWWAWTWRSYEPLRPLWLWALKIDAWGLCVIGAAAAIAVGAQHLRVHGLRADLHGSARWATLRDILKAGFLPRRKWFRKVPQGRGIYVGRWRGRLLKDAGEGHVMVFAPTRTGKGAGVILPTLLSWDASVFVNDIKGENWALTAGWRKSRGHTVLKFEPGDPSGASARYNPLDEIRVGTPYEFGDAQSLSHALIFPNGEGGSTDDYWHPAAKALLTGGILHVLHEGDDPTLHGVLGLFTDPARPREAVIKELLKSKHRLVAESMREFHDMAEKQASGVVGQMNTALDIYRDPIVRDNTACSDFRLSQLMNHERPVSLYLVIQQSDQERLGRLVRVLIQQIIREFTRVMDFEDGRAVARYKHPLLMVLDEFPTYGKFGHLEKMLSLVAGYGIRCCVVAQDLVQIKSIYGPYESITSNCDTRVAFTPNNPETSRALSGMTGLTTVKREQRSRSSNGYVTESEPETSRPLIDDHEVSTLDPEHALIFPHGYPAIHARKIRHWQIPELDKRSKVKPPQQSDRLPVPARSPRKQLVLTPDAKPRPKAGVSLI